MSTDIFVVTAVEHGDCADGKARTVGCFTSRDKAESVVRTDMEKWASDHNMTEEDFGYNPGRMCMWPDNDNGCEWNIEKSKVED